MLPKKASLHSIDCFSFISLHQQGYKVTKQGKYTVIVGWKGVGPTTQGGKNSSTTNMNVDSETRETKSVPSMAQEVFFTREVCFFLPSRGMFCNIYLVLFQTYSIRIAQLFLWFTCFGDNHEIITEGQISMLLCK